MAALAAQLGPTDRLIIYANVHSGAIDPSKPAGPGNDAIILWSEKKPEVRAFAVAGGVWITAAEFAGMVHKVPAGEVVVMFDACESGAITPLFLRNHPDDDPSRPEAVVTSAKFDQVANFAADGSMGLFTEQFGLSLQSTEGHLEDAVMRAVAATEKAAIPICRKKALELEKLGFRANSCDQQPTVHDPDGILAHMNLE
ncbi:hypothetical protein [Roseibium aggregatum]|uniref:Caspase domain-containing protein n=1 Tax=Roseibium aggregatum TaxID=187304 RepID=A0A926P2G1_9HYPH|nr:hypothetical protein [Roseibium aggregatum]MBD1545312.1 hypothetical protein [Roseibium aggregatum]